MPSRAGRPTLTQALDRDVYQVVRKIVDSGDAPRLTVSAVYENIRRSNSSLNRRNRKQLEDSISRVLDVMKDEAEEDSDDVLEGDFDDLESTRPADDLAVQANGLNRSIVGAWAKSPNPVVPRRKMVERDQAQESSSQAPTMKERRLANGEPQPKKRKGAATVDRSASTHLSLADLGGVDDVINKLKKLIVLPMTQPHIYAYSKVKPPRGVLLHGPPGCGKTMIANAFAAELGVPFINISAPSIVSGMSGESEKALRDHFEEARKAAPCLIFIDEIDAITPKRESAQREMEKRIVAQLLTCMDDLALEKTGGKAVIVLAATNRPDSLDAALRRGGRFDKEINMSVPNEPVREKILRALTREMQLSQDVDFPLLAKRTPGFVGADLSDLVTTAGSAAIDRYLQVLEAQAVDDMEVETQESAQEVSLAVKDLRSLIKRAKETPENEEPSSFSITNSDFFTALPEIQPSSKREGFATIPDTTWADVGALGPVREELMTVIVNAIKDPEIYARAGVTVPPGVLLWGPPGCGKTLLAKAVANESKTNFISVKGPELLNKYVGESERAVRQVFVRARSSVPCVIFFDELDALVPRRDDTLSEASARVVNTLLTELDGLASREGIYVIAATNRPDIIDPAMLRPGRLGTLVYVGLPNAEERVEILQTLVRKMPLEFNDQVKDIARACSGFSGADMSSLLRRAGYAAVDRRDTIKLEDFVLAKQNVRPSVTDMSKYERLKRLWGEKVA